MLLPLSSSVIAQNDDTSENIQGKKKQLAYEEVFVTGGKEAIRTLPGSASFVDEEMIAKFDSTDINSLLGQVPGVYLRVEDGYGLRPNIGLRGATSERSQKITLMEDGVLISPSPYSAPAAYYFPNISRMSAVEVFKGPSAIHYGPHTVGGAVNLVTPTIPSDQEGMLEASVGTDAYQKYRLFYGDSGDQFGYWIDALHYGADGFKELDGGGDTGFKRNDFNTKLQWRSSDAAEVYQQLDLKLGYADEDSDETYLGLSDADFDDDSARRYTASQLDRFESEHSQAHLFYLARFNDAWQVNAKGYVNRFDRSWIKFDGFIDGVAPVVVLANPEGYMDEMALLRGESNSDGTNAQALDITDFAREHGSQGVELAVTHWIDSGVISHKLEAGVRYHHDYVERDHSQRGYDMIDGSLVYDGVLREKSALNKAETDAVAVFFNNEMDYEEWKLNIGLRYENIEGTFDDKLASDKRSNDQDIILPGFGVFYQWTESTGLLFGVNKGFSPAGPGAGSSIDPEESINYEYGLRYQHNEFTADVIGFFSDYENLLGRCRVSDEGCEAGEEFNGGSVEIAGVEITSAYTADLNNGLLLPLSLVYTYTESAFQDSFYSGFSQWNPDLFDGGYGSVVKGDELPYMPENQLRLQMGLMKLDWSIDLAVSYVDEMREVPGRGSFDEGTSTRAYTTVDLAGSYLFAESWQLKLVAENITDKQVIVSRRPFGARPNSPRLLKLGVSYRF